MDKEQQDRAKLFQRAWDAGIQAADKQAAREAYWAKEALKIRANRSSQRKAWQQGYEDAISDLVEEGQTDAARILRAKLGGTR